MLYIFYQVEKPGKRYFLLLACFSVSLPLFRPLPFRNRAQRRICGQLGRRRMEQRRIGRVKNSSLPDRWPDRLLFCRLGVFVCTWGISVFCAGEGIYTKPRGSAYSQSSTTSRREAGVTALRVRSSISSSIRAALVVMLGRSVRSPPGMAIPTP